MFAILLSMDSGIFNEAILPIFPEIMNLKRGTELWLNRQIF
jgi:hypothetical protein